MEPKPQDHTYEEYAAAYRKYLIEEEGVSPEEVKGAFRQQWQESIERAADSGVRLPDRVLDSYMSEFGQVAFASTFRGRAEQKGYAGYAQLGANARLYLRGSGSF